MNGNSFDISVQKWQQIEHGCFICKFTLEDGVVHDLILETIIPEQTSLLLQSTLNYQTVNKHRQCRTRFCISGCSIACCQLRLEVSWANAESLNEASSNKENDILALIIGGQTSESADAWSPRDFYESVHVPAKNDRLAESLVVDGLESTLFPYQKRTVQWMLDREGVDTRGRTVNSTQTHKHGDHGFTHTVDTCGNQIWVNPWLGLVTTDDSLLNDSAMTVRGVSFNC